jgi:hypothetical protein
MSGSFAHWQAEYARHGIPTFPVTIDGARKTPAVKGYLRLSEQRSRELVARFPDCDAFGFRVGSRSGVTVLDVDSRDERELADALDRHGATPVVVRSGGGKFQAWYRHSGERRQIRPDPSRPIDVLGGGYVVAPPSRGSVASYQFLNGGLDDIGRLPVLQNPPVAGNGALAHAITLAGLPAKEGARNNDLFRYCLRAARGCDDLDGLLDAARSQNENFMPPLADGEVVKVARSAWSYEQSGCNFSGGAVVSMPHADIDGLLMASPDAFVLLTILRRHHWARPFVAANEMADTMPGGAWTRKRFAAARTVLEASQKIRMVRPASRTNGPALYRWP